MRKSFMGHKRKNLKSGFLKNAGVQQKFVEKDGCKVWRIFAGYKHMKIYKNRKRGGNKEPRERKIS